LLDVGERFYSRFEHTTLVRTGLERYELITSDGVRLLFAPIIGVANTATLPVHSVQDANGNGWHLHYGGQSFPQALEGSDGDRIGFIYDERFATPRLVEIQRLADAGCAAVAPRPLVHYRYTAEGDLAEVLDERGQSCRRFAYQSHQLIEQQHADGRTFTYQWDTLAPEGRIVVMQRESGQRWQFDYDKAERRVSMIETAHHGLTRTSTQWFDEDQHPIAIVDAAGGRTEIERNAYGDIIAQTDPSGHVTTYAYDHLSRQTRVTHPDGSTQETRWHPELHQPITVTDALGHRTGYHYDDRGNLLSTTDPEGHLTAYTYDHRGLPVTITDPLGHTQQLDYNRRGQLIAYTDSSGQRTAFCWDDEGHLLSTTDALGHVTRDEHQRLNRQPRLIARHLADGSVERFAYDPAGRLIAYVDPLGQPTRWQLDADGRPMTRTDALGHHLRYHYDGFGRLSGLTNENGAHYRFAWDALDRLIAERGFDGRRLDYRYDPAGHLVEMADGLAQGAAWMAASPTAIRTHYRRDPLGRLRERLAHKPGQRPQRTRYDYDAAGQLILARNADARVQLLYTPDGHIARELVSTRLGQRSTLTHRYDALGQRMATVLPDGRTLNTLTDGTGHVHQLNLDGEVICDIERDGLHREMARRQGALTSRYRLDALGRLLESRTHRNGEANAPSSHAAQHAPHNTTHGQQIARRYHYDAAGQLLSIDDPRIGLTHYHYDALGRLTQALAPHARERFAFDPAHNLIDAALPSASTGTPPALTEAQWADYVQAHIHDPDFNPLQTDPAAPVNPEHWGPVSDNRLKHWQAHRYRYDPWGNCTEKRSGGRPIHHYHWDAEHQLTSAHIDDPRSGRTETWHYAYDPFGRRIAKWKAPPVQSTARPPPPAAITHFTWDGNRLLAERTTKHPHTRHRLYLYEPDSFVPLAQVESVWDKEEPRPPPRRSDRPLSCPGLEPAGAGGPKRPVSLARAHRTAARHLARPDGPPGRPVAPTGARQPHPVLPYRPSGDTEGAH